MGKIHKISITKSTHPDNYKEVVFAINKYDARNIISTVTGYTSNKLEFVDFNNRKLLYMFISSDCLACECYINGEKIVTIRTASDNLKYAFIDSVTIGDNFVSLSFITDDSVNARKSSSTFLFTKTYKNELCFISPNSGCLIQEINIVNNTKTPTYLQALTRKSNYSDIKSYQPYAAFNDYTTIFTPVLVNGDDDYCPHVFYTPSTDIKLSQSDDGIIDYNGKHYWYNGFIAVEI